METTPTPLAPRVQTGKLAMTASVRDWMRTREHGATDIAQLLARHARGDWGTVDAHDAAINEQGLHEDGRLLSSYEVDDRTVWVITEADRSATTVLFPADH